MFLNEPYYLLLTKLLCRCKTITCTKHIIPNRNSPHVSVSPSQSVLHDPLLTNPGLMFPSQSVHVELSPPQTSQKSISLPLFSTPSQPK